MQGVDERCECYDPILQAINDYFPREERSVFDLVFDSCIFAYLISLSLHGAFCCRSSVRVCVPGCGLGRLPWELARLGAPDGDDDEIDLGDDGEDVDDESLTVRMAIMMKRKRKK